VTRSRPSPVRALVDAARTTFVRRAVALVALASFALAMVALPAATPYLLDPGTYGNDAWNYLAAGERLNAGHPLYELSPGDRPVPIAPPYWETPLVAPPIVAVIWRPLAAVGFGTVWVWWLGGMVATSVATLWVIARGPVLANLAVILLSPEIAWTAWSGNANAYVLAALVAGWALHRMRPAVAGPAIAFAAVVRVTTAITAIWAVVHPSRRLAVPTIVAIGVFATLSLVGAGWANHVAWVELAGSSAADPTPNSLAARLLGAGFPTWVVGAGPFIILAAMPLVLWRLRARPALGWAVAVVASVALSPISHAGMTALLLAAVAALVPPHVGESSPGELVGVGTG
jgi:hypothetical protein